jgi:hypothetical protein
MATFLFAAHNRFAMLSSICEAWLGFGLDSSQQLGCDP